MDGIPPPAPPAWVRKRDGQIVPFEADKISRALFASTEALGRPDAFLARELADGVVHFLTEENSGATPTTADIAELVAKVVRELGQPALAETFADFGQRRPRAPGTATGAAPADQPTRREIVLRFPLDAPLAAVLSACTREYTLQNVFTRDLVSAQGDGLLTLTALDVPGELASCVLGPRTAPSLATAGLAAGIGEVRHVAGRCVVLDGPEHGLARSGKLGEADARDLVHELRVGLAATQLECVVNLNALSPPSWADDLAEGPLFTELRRAPAVADLARLADALAEELLRPGQLPRAARIDWHLGERDFQPEPPARGRLVGLAQRALDGLPLAFAFDRPRRAVALAEGIDRQHPAVLLTVGLHLPRLTRQAGVDGDGTRFLHKLGSLARLALSAGVQKREFLRRRERARSGKPADLLAVTSGFLLDRARLLVAPVGLDAVVAHFTGQGLGAGGAALDFARQVVQRLGDVLRQDGAGTRLDTCLDGPFHFRLGEPQTADSLPLAAEAAGLSAWDAAAPVKDQWRSAGALHGIAGGGTMALFLPEDRPTTAEQVADWLRTVWKQTDVVRLRLVRPPHRQMTFAGG
jgi:hypothetical protein